MGTSVAANHEIAPDKWLGDTNMDRAVSMNMIETDEDFEYTRMKWAIKNKSHFCTLLWMTAISII